MSIYKKRISGIYELRWDDAIYIGSSMNIMSRWHSHIINPQTSKDLTAKILSELPTFKILYIFDKKPQRNQLLKIEQEYINKYANNQTNLQLLNKRTKLLKDIINEKPKRKYIRKPKTVQQTNN